MRDLILDDATIDDLRFTRSCIDDLIKIATYASFMGIDMRFRKELGCHLLAILKPGDTYAERHRLQVEGLDLGEDREITPEDLAEGLEPDPPEPEETEEVPPIGEDPVSEPAGPQPEQTAASAGDGPAAGGEGADLAATPPAATRPDAWTAEQDDQMVEGTAPALLEGKAFTPATYQMAEKLGRTKQACFNRAHTKLRDRIEARLAELSRSPAPPCRPQADDRSLLQRYLDDLPPVRDWSTGKDADLLRLAIAGMGLEDIAVEMDLRGADVRARFDLLTGHHKVEEGERSTWRRRFTREEVLAELEARLPQAAE